MMEIEDDYLFDDDDIFGDDYALAEVLSKLDDEELDALIDDPSTEWEVEEFELEPQGDGIVRENLIAFWHEQAYQWSNHSSKVIKSVARGIAKMGSSVCIVNPENQRTIPHDDPVPSSIRGVKITFAHDVSRVLELCDEFDYVLVARPCRQEYDASLEAAEIRDDLIGLNSHVARFITSSPIFHISERHPLHARTFYVVAGYKRGVLALDNQGFPRVITKKEPTDLDVFSPPLMPIETNLPVIAYHWSGSDDVKIAQAVLGLNDPRDFYISHAKVKAHSAVVAAPAVTAGVGMLSSLFALPFLASTYSPLVAGAAAAGGVVVYGGVQGVRRLSETLPFKNRRKEKRFIEDIYPDEDIAQVRFDLTAPPLALNSGNERSLKPRSEQTVLLSDLTWAKVVDRYRQVQQRWREYEFDVSRMLDAPLIVDYSVPQTAALSKAMNKANDLFSTATDSSMSERHTNVARELFIESVADLEVAFEVAESHALKEGIRGFAQNEQRKIALSKKLFAVANDDNASTAEREGALKKARKTLDGILVVPEMTIRMIEASHANRQITTG